MTECWSVAASWLRPARPACCRGGLSALLPAPLSLLLGPLRRRPQRRSLALPERAAAPRRAEPGHAGLARRGQRGAGGAGRRQEGPPPRDPPPPLRRWAARRRWRARSGSTLPQCSSGAWGGVDEPTLRWMPLKLSPSWSPSAPLMSCGAALLYRPGGRSTAWSLCLHAWRALRTTSCPRPQRSR